MTIHIRISESGLTGAGPLAEYATQAVPNLYPRSQQESFNNPVGHTYAPGPGFIASVPRLSGSSNINPDGTFPTAIAAERDISKDLIVHVSPTSGSSIIRGNGWNPTRAEYEPSYGLDVTIDGLEMQPDVFETAINEPIGGQFKANLQDYVARGILEVSEGPTGPPMTPGEIGDYTAP
jgi:hypothetical protein